MSAGLDPRPECGTVAVAGASGFIGGRLAADLHARGRRVRRLTRTQGLADAPGEWVRFDLASRRSLQGALEGVDTAYYLIHAMTAGGDFVGEDRRYARRFARAAQRAGVRRVIFLGGLHPPDAGLSAHLASRREVGQILMDGCGALVIRAGIVVGSGGAAWIVMRDLVRRLPLMVGPTWLSHLSQPTTVRDVVAALGRAPRLPAARVVDVGGPTVMTYEEMLRRIAMLMGRRQPAILKLPPRGSGLLLPWMRLISRVPTPLVGALSESLQHDTVVQGPNLYRELGIRPQTFESGVRAALREDARRAAAD